MISMRWFVLVSTNESPVMSALSMAKTAPSKLVAVRIEV
jgi:hypothetical protein